MRLALLSAIVLMCSLVGGCVRSFEPVLSDDQVITNNDLLGRWNSTNNEREYFEITSGDNKTYKAVYHDEKGKTGKFIVRLGEIDDLIVAEVTPDEPGPEVSDTYRAHLVPVYSFFILTEMEPDLVGKAMKADWFKKYIDEHPNELQVARPHGDVIISSPTKDIQKFIIKHMGDADAFEEVTFVRPDTARPATQPAKR